MRTCTYNRISLYFVPYNVPYNRLYPYNWLCWLCLSNVPRLTTLIIFKYLQLVRSRFNIRFVIVYVADIFSIIKLLQEIINCRSLIVLIYFQLRINKHKYELVHCIIFKPTAPFVCIKLKTLHTRSLDAEDVGMANIL